MAKTDAIVITLTRRNQRGSHNILQMEVMAEDVPYLLERLPLWVIRDVKEELERSKKIQEQIAKRAAR